MDVVNQGNNYTYDGSNKGHTASSSKEMAGKTIIDATMVTTQYSDQIKGWKVSKEKTHSSHCMINFSIHVPTPNYTFVLDTKRTDLQALKEQADKLVKHILDTTHTRRDVKQSREWYNASQMT